MLENNEVNIAQLEGTQYAAEQRTSNSQVDGSSPSVDANRFTYDEVQFYRETLRQRDGDNCYLCSRYIDQKGIMDELPTIDHVYPKSLGGPDNLWNLRLTHKICNMIKSNSIDASEIENKIKQNFPEATS